VLSIEDTRREQGTSPGASRAGAVGEPAPSPTNRPGQASGTEGPHRRAKKDDEMVRRAKDGCQRAMAEVFERYRPGVVRLARRHGGRGASLPDLVQEGNLGLLDAIDGFDPERRVAFWTYAHYWVSYRIRRFVLANRRIVRMPRTRAARRLWGSLGRTERELTAELGEQPSRAQLAERLDVDESALEDFAGFISQCNDVEIDAWKNPDLEAGTASPEELALERESRTSWRDSVAEAMDDLDEREKHIIQSRFLSSDGASYASLGRKFGISRERVRQLAERGLRKMRGRVEKTLPDDLRFAETG